MEHLILVRHGATQVYKTRNEDPELSIEGRSKVTGLAKQIKDILSKNDPSKYMISSEALRAVQTAEIIASALGIDSFERSKLVGYPERQLQLHPLLMKYGKNKDAIIVVGHDDLSMYARGLAEDTFNLDWLDIDFGRFNKGDGIYVNFASKSFKPLE